MRFILSTGSLYNYSLDRVFALAAESGFDGIEVLIDHRWDSRQSDHLRQLMESHQLLVPALHSPFSRNCSGWGETEHGAITRTAQLAAELGSQAVVHHLPTRFVFAYVQTVRGSYLIPNPLDSSHRKYTEWLKRDYAALQDETQVLLCIENMPALKILGRRVNPAHWNAHSRATFDDITRFPNITLDTTHLGTWGLDPLEAYERWGQRVKHVHLSNYDGSEHRRPEDGILRLDALLARMAADGYAHSISLELHPDALEAGAPDSRIVELLRGSLNYCRQAAG